MTMLKRLVLEFGSEELIQKAAQAAQAPGLEAMRDLAEESVQLAAAGDQQILLVYEGLEVHSWCRPLVSVTGCTSSLPPWWLLLSRHVSIWSSLSIATPLCIGTLGLGAVGAEVFPSPQRGTCASACIWW